METILILLAVFGIAGINWACDKIHQHQLDIERLDRLTSKSNVTDPVTPPA